MSMCVCMCVCVCVYICVRRFCSVSHQVCFCVQLLPEQRGDPHQSHPEWSEPDGKPARLRVLCARPLNQPRRQVTFLFITGHDTDTVGHHTFASFLRDAGAKQVSHCVFTGRENHAATSSLLLCNTWSKRQCGRSHSVLSVDMKIINLASLFVYETSRVIQLH